MYELIAKDYHRLFPYDSQRIDLLAAWGLGPPAAILDIGAATGDFAWALAAAGYRVEAWEPDASLLAEAARVGEASGTAAPAFRQLGMLDLTMTEAYEAIFCMGNTLPHLGSGAEVDDFLGRARAALKPGGRLVLQLINFDLVRRDPGFAFPVMETENLRFARSYSEIGEASLRFSIEITDKASGQSRSDSCRLYPIGRAELARRLVAAGFQDPGFYADYRLSPLGEGNRHFLAIGRA